MDKVKAITDHNGLCWKCLKDKVHVNIIKIHEMGYGSGFDNWSTEIHLCDECYQESIKSNKELWCMEERHDLYGKGLGEDYKYEDEMFKYIEKLPIQGKELVRNTYAYKSFSMGSQDWIDYELGILSHKKCKKYGLYSPQEIKAYEEKFPTCEYVVNRIWSDNSKGSYCPFDAGGNYNQECSCNISTECYGCKYYKKRITQIKDIKNSEFSDYMEYIRLKIRQAELKKKFE